MSDLQAPGDNELLESMLGDFLDESDQLLSRLNENLMHLDDWVRTLDDAPGQKCDENILNELFRSAHSLKGLSAMLGLSDINHLTHRVENVFDAARSGQLSFSGDAVELMFRSVDRLSAMVELLREPGGEPVSSTEVIEAIQGLLQGARAEKAPSCQGDAEKAFAAAQAEVGADRSPPPEPSDAPSPAPVAAAAAPPAAPPADCFDEVQDELEISPKYLSLFVDEAEVALDKLTESLLALESDERPEELRRAMGVAHQIKGSAASVGLNRAARLAHVMEDLLQQVIEMGGRLSPPAVSAMLQGTDGLRQYIESLRRGQPAPGPLAEFARQLAAPRNLAPLVLPEGATGSLPARGTPAPADKPPVAPGRASADEGHAREKAGFPSDLRQRVAAAAPPGVPCMLGEVRFQLGLPLAGMKALLIYEKLVNLGEICHFDPAPQGLEERDDLDCVRFGLAGEQPEEAIRQHLCVAGVRSVELTLLSATDTSRAAVQHDSARSEPAPVSLETSRGVPASRSMPGGQPGVSPASRAASEAQPTASEKDRPIETMRVDTGRLDQLMNLAGQLATSRARFTQIGDNLKGLSGASRSAKKAAAVLSLLDKFARASDAESGLQGRHGEVGSLRAQVPGICHELKTLHEEIESLAQARSSIADLLEAVHQLERVSTDIQEGVMATRMAPIGPLFNRFRRVVRDIGRADGKEIRLVIRGEKTELDKRLIDELSDPLTHAIRNAADHGIESPEARVAAGKPPEGTVTLDAFHRGNSIMIQVSDDGNGLDSDQILRKCLEKELVTEAEAATMTPRQIWQMIWKPGFSTAKKVTEVSGRGMGMDIVRAKVADLSGTVDLDSAPGQGTTLTIKLPITLAILPSLMVEIDGDCLAVPMESVKEILRVPAKDLVSIRGHSAVCVRDRTILLKRLEQLFTWQRHRAVRAAGGDGLVTLVIVGEAGQEIALAVDRVVGEQDVVIKSIAENYRNIRGVAGATVLGNGRVSLILDVPALIESQSKKITPSLTPGGLPS